MDACVAEIRHILDHALKAGKQVIRILEIGDGMYEPLYSTIYNTDNKCIASASLYNLLNASFADYPTLRVDYTASGHERIVSPNLRAVAFNIDSTLERQDLPAFTYDVVIEVHTLGFAADLQRNLRLLNELLSPGGFLLALEANGNHQTAGGKWVDYVFSPQENWPGLRLGKQYRRVSQPTWDEQLRRAGFSAVDAEKDCATALFLTLRAQKLPLPIVSTSFTYIEQPVIFSFKLTHALDFQKTLLAATSSSGGRSVVWIEATMGTFDGAAATGFPRSLRRELVSMQTWSSLTQFGTPIRESQSFNNSLSSLTSNPRLW